MGPITASSIIAAIISACGPMYGPQPAQKQPPQQVNGPPGGGDPWANDPNDPSNQSPPNDPPPRRNDPPPRPEPPPRPDPPRPEPPRRPDPRPEPPPQTAGTDQQKLLAAHNKYRAAHCAAPMTWSPKLEQVAQGWANSLRDQGCKFGHSGSQYGENLAAGTAGTLDGNSVTAMWYDEIKEYSFASGGFSMNTGHFTQVVWRQSTQLGCAKVTCKGMDIYVCNYDPPGNVDRGYKQNVLPTSCK